MISTVVPSRTFFDINPALTTCNALIYSYAKDCRLPISFTHYNHEHPLRSFIASEKSNNWCTLFISLSGNFSFIIDNQLYFPTHGNVIFIRDHEKYISCFRSVSHVDYYEINFPPEFFDSTPVASIFRAPFYDRPYAERNMLVVNKANCTAIIEKLAECERIAHSGNPHSDILIYSHIIQIMGLLFYEFSNQKERFLSAKTPAKLNEAILYIHEHFLTINSVNEVSTACGITNTYLSRIFKTHLFCSPNDYITNLKISHAKQLLSLGKSIMDTCFDSGFNNYTYFISKFKSVTGTTPLKFSKSKEKTAAFLPADSNDAKHKEK